MDAKNNLETILFDKDGFTFIQVNKNHYKLLFSIENKNIIMSKIIDLNLIKLVYDLNPDIYEYVSIEKRNDDEMNSTLLMKHFFQDIGISQKYSLIHTTKSVEERNITFKSYTLKSHRPQNLPQDAELLDLKDVTCVCHLATPYKTDFAINLIFDPHLGIPSFIEKIIGMIFYKIFKRIKQFIENVSL
jgi:hypothetical protein